MKTTRHLWTWRPLLVAGLLCGWAELSGRGAEPAPPLPPGSPFADAAAKPTAAAGDIDPGVYVERLLEELPPPRVMMWDDRDLWELRLRLSTDKDAARRRQKQAPPSSNQWRAFYGPVAPLVTVPKHARGLEDYRVEIDRLEYLMKQDRASSADLMVHGRIHLESGRWSVAVRDFDQAIRLAGSPSDQAYCLRGVARYHLGEYRAALADLNEAVRLSADVRNLNNRGVIACAMGQTDLALQDFDAARNIRQANVKVTPVVINRALALSDLGKHNDAIAELNRVIDEAVGSDPDAVGQANRAAGLIYRRLGDFRRSFFSYDSVIQLERAVDAIALGQLSIVDENAGEETTVDALLGRGISNHELNKVIPAIEDYSKAIRLDPEQPVAFVNRAVAYMDRGDWKLAERDLEAALRLNPNDAFALGNRGLLRIRQGQGAQGEADLARCRELRKDLQPLIQRIASRSQPSQPHLRPSPFADPTTPPRRP